jgi:hypothetical protein
MSEKINMKISERELTLVDRIIGLEAENARLRMESEIRDIRILQNSRPWRVGMIVLQPVVFLRKLRARIGR